MSNDTEKILIDDSLVRRLIKRQFPQWADLAIKPVEMSGWDNRTFHLGEQMSVRLPSDEEYAAQVAREQYWLPKLAPHLPLKIPVPIAMGKPDENYPWDWSIYKWLTGETAAHAHISNLQQFATTLGNFLSAFQRCDPTNGPVSGVHNFYRGGSLTNYDIETRQAIEILGDRIDIKAAIAVWNTALDSEWNQSPVWVHGDIAVGNLLVENGELTAVIDFGQLCIGDPACDLAIAWTFFNNESRQAFRKALPLDNATWERGRGWTLWKALIVYAGLCGTNPLETERSKQTIDEVLLDHKHNRQS